MCSPADNPDLSAPTRITGVTSNGMLLAATNNACGCQVIFVDERVPEGTRLH